MESRDESLPLLNSKIVERETQPDDYLAENVYSLERHPEYDANICSKLWFCWTNKLINPSFLLLL